VYHLEQSCYERLEQCVFHTKAMNFVHPVMNLTSFMTSKKRPTMCHSVRNIY